MKHIVLILGLVLLTTLLNGQNRSQKWCLGLNFGFKEYTGDLGNSLFQYDETTIKNTYTDGISIGAYLNPSFDIVLMANYGSWGYFGDSLKMFKSEVIHANLHFKFKFYNGSTINENSIIQPYIIAGAGVSSFQPTKNASSGKDMNLIVGPGINFQLSDAFGLSYQIAFVYDIDSDDRDLSTLQKPNDSMLLHTIGFNFSLGKKYASSSGNKRRGVF